MIVIGAGFAGLCAIHQLRAAGFSVRAFEAGPDVGGTWFWNRYPGARCDVESADCSYSFDPELEQEWTWTERFRAQPEILAYLRHVADRFDLRRHIEFGTRVSATRYDGQQARWQVTTDAGVQATARFCFLATAGFPNLFLIAGPGSPAVLTNMVASIEQQVDWLVGYLRALRAGGHTETVATEAAEAQWGARLAAAAQRTLYPQAASWYNGANTPGKPRQFMVFLGGLANYARICDDLVRDGYPGFQAR